MGGVSPISFPYATPSLQSKLPQVQQMLGLGQTDIYVVNIARMQQFLPLGACGIKVVSVDLSAEPAHPLTWRDPQLEDYHLRI